MYEIGEEEIEALARLIRGKKLFRFGGTPEKPTETDHFERELGAHMGAKHTLAVNSGTSALICALVGAGVEPGDEVLVPGYTFMATALAVLNIGAVPVLTEVDAGLMLDPLDVARKIGPRTKAIVPVHMMGHVADLEPILKIASERNAMVIEDACQCVGGSYRGKRTGTWGRAGAYSFNFYKILTCGEGGAMVTSDEKVWQRARIQHDTGTAWRDDAPELKVPVFAGENYRFDEMRAAVMRVQLKRLEGILSRLRARNHGLRERLGRPATFEFAPVHDLAGFAGTAMFLRLENRAQAQAFAAEAAKRQLSAGLPYDSGRHVYSNWEPLIKRRGAFHPGRDPLATTEAGKAQAYTVDALPRTLEHLSRTVSIGIGLDWTEQQLDEAAEKIKLCGKHAASPVAAQ
ncbi:MAG: hypothetical protein AMXMBFR7_07480 [Planctomycetota bacterium]